VRSGAAETEAVTGAVTRAPRQAELAGGTSERLTTRTMHAARRLSLLITLAALLHGCGGTTIAGPDALPPPLLPPSDALVPAGAPDSAHVIDNERIWGLLAARPENEVFARTEVVKFLIDLEDARKLWLMQSTRWPIHYDFARRFLTGPAPVESHAAFNVREYRRADRRFICGSLVHYLDSDTWTFEMLAGDDLDGSRVAQAFEQIRAAVYFGGKLHYRPLSTLHEERIAGVRGRLDVITTDALVGNLRYQPLTPGIAYGVLRIVRGELDLATVRAQEILVTADVPDDLPMTMALITSQLQAPLAHVAILSANRATPNMALRGAMNDARFVALDGQVVKLSVGPQEFSIAAAPQAEADAAWAAMRPAAAFAPRLDLRSRALVDMCDVGSAELGSVGAKAAQLGEVCRLGGEVHTPGGFVLPTTLYVDHLVRSRVETTIRSMLADPAFRSDRSVRATQLTALRDAIATAPIDPALLRQVHDRIALLRRASGNNGRLIFRSSTNAEDLPGFNGAGLYESIVVAAGADDAAIGQAIRRVWASVWTLRGFEERDWFRIDHTAVAMAVLVQPFVPNAVANGVAITRNPFNEGRPAVFINVQVMGGSVTGARNDVPEQHLVYTYSEQLEDEIVGRSTMTNGAAVMSTDEVERLARVLQSLHATLVPTYGASANAVDVEFLVGAPAGAAQRTITIVQARPYRVTYTDGQRYRPL